MNVHYMYKVEVSIWWSWRKFHLKYIDNKNSVKIELNSHSISLLREHQPGEPINNQKNNKIVSVAMRRMECGKCNVCVKNRRIVQFNDANRELLVWTTLFLGFIGDAKKERKMYGYDFPVDGLLIYLILFCLLFTCQPSMSYSILSLRLLCLCAFLLLSTKRPFLFDSQTNFSSIFHMILFIFVEIIHVRKWLL